MAIFRGVGGAGTASDNAFLLEISEASEAAQAAAQQAEQSALAAVNAEVSSATFNTSDGVLTLTKTGGATVTADLDGRFLTSYTETNDLSTAVTWANVPDANITESSVTQHLTASNVSAAGALMDSEVTNLAQVKAFDSSDYATSAQGTTADNALPKAGGQMTGNITFSGTQTVDGRDLSVDGAKLDNIEANADVTDTANVTSAGALMTTGGQLTGNITFSGTQTVDGRDLSVDGSKLDSIKKRTFGNTTGISITTTSPVTIFEGGIAAPNVNALQTMTARFHLRVSNSSTANKLNNQYYLTKFLYSKGTSGVSIGTATYDSSPSPYNAWYYVSGDKTDIIVPNRGRMATSSAGASSGQVLGSYYDSTNNRTYFRISKFPDATTVYNNVTVYYSVDSFVNSGSYVANNNNFNSRYFSLLAKSLSTPTYQSPDIAIEDSFGRSSTATKFKIEIDFITSLTNISVGVYDFMGHTEVSP